MQLDSGLGNAISAAAGEYIILFLFNPIFNREVQLQLNQLKKDTPTIQTADIFTTTSANLEERGFSKIMHVVSPYWNPVTNAFPLFIIFKKETYEIKDALALCIRKCLIEALNEDCVVIPGIGIGMNGVPLDVCAGITLVTFRQFLTEHPDICLRMKIVDINAKYIDEVKFLLKLFSFGRAPLPEKSGFKLPEPEKSPLTGMYRATFAKKFSPDMSLPEITIAKEKVFVKPTNLVAPPKTNVYDFCCFCNAHISTFKTMALGKILLLF